MKSNEFLNLIIILLSMSAKQCLKKLIDVGANLTDPMFRGIYHGSKKHQDDLEEVIKRAKLAGVEKIIVTGGSLEDSAAALNLVKSYENLYSTVGCHPTRCNEFEYAGDPDAYLSSLISLAAENVGKVVAVGEFGLDYDRLEFAPKEIQKKYFEKQFDVAEATGLPLFLHCRNAADDLIEILQRNRDRFKTGVVHSFDGDADSAKLILDMDLFIGINGCSLKNDGSLEVVKDIPADKLVIETDCPWCEIRPTHASFKHVTTQFPSRKKEKWDSAFQVKGRNEPCNLMQVLEVVAALRGESADNLAQVIYDTTHRIFFHHET